MRASGPTEKAAHDGVVLRRVRAEAARPARTADNGGDETGLLSIGRLAELSGVSSRTIRYYEELGILPTPQRSTGGTRKYPHAYRFFIEGALALKDLGFTLEEIRLVGRIALGEERRVAERRRASVLVREKVRRLEHKIRVLSRLRDVLQNQRGDGVPTPVHKIAELISVAREAPVEG